MRHIFSTSLNYGYTHMVLLIIRVASGLFMLTHGVPKFLKLTSGDPIKFADPFGLGPAFSLVLAVFAEFICSILIITGAGTRIASVFLIITMLVAAFHAHAKDSFATKEKALLYVIIFTALMIFGSGKYSLDHFIYRKK
jgi:putative oxidoreductase